MDFGRARLWSFPH